MNNIYKMLMIPFLFNSAFAYSDSESQHLMLNNSSSLEQSDSTDVVNSLEMAKHTIDILESRRSRFDNKIDVLIKNMNSFLDKKDMLMQLFNYYYYWGMFSEFIRDHVQNLYKPGIKKWKHLITCDISFSDSDINHIRGWEILEHDMDTLRNFLDRLSLDLCDENFNSNSYNTALQETFPQGIESYKIEVDNRFNDLISELKNTLNEG